MLLFFKILLVILHILLLPINLIVLFLLFLYKQIIVLLAKLNKDFVGPIPSSSCVFLADEIWTNPSSSIVVALELEKKASAEDISSQWQKAYDLEDESGARCYRELGYNPVMFCGYGFWEEHKDFKISDRVHFLKESENADQEEEPLASISERMLKEPYKHGEPLWDVYILYKSNMESDKTIMFIRFHHLMSDGMSFVKLFYAMFDHHSLPEAFTKPSTSMKRWDKMSSSVLAKLSAFLSLLTVGFIDYLDQVLISQDRNPINFDPNGKMRLTGEWICSIGKKLEVNELKRASKSYDCSILHLILSGINRGLEKYFRKYHHDEPPPNHAHFVFPVPIPGHPDLRLVNHWALARIRSRLDIGDLSEKLQELKEEIKKAASAPLPLISAFMFMYALGILPIGLVNAISKAKTTSTVVLSNVVGPQFGGTFGGKTITDMFFWMPIVRESMALSAGVISFNGGMHICLTADLGCIPDRSLLDDLSRMIHEELIENCKVGKY